MAETDITTKDALNYLDAVNSPGVGFRFGITFSSSFSSTDSNFIGDSVTALNLTADSIDIPKIEIQNIIIPTAGPAKHESVATGYSVGDLVIKKAVVISNPYFSWFESHLNSTEYPSVDVYKDCVIQQFNANGDIIRNFVITKCKPKSYKGPKLNANEDSLAFEELVIKVDGKVTSSSFFGVNVNATSSSIFGINF